MSDRPEKMNRGGEKPKVKASKPKTKGVSFQLDNPIENHMWHKANEMGGSFSSLMKYLFLGYLTRNEIGVKPIDVDLPHIDIEDRVETVEKTKINDDDKGIMGMQFSLDD